MHRRSSHDSWERLVEAVLRREQLWEIALDHSWSPSATYSDSNSDVDGVKMVEDMRSNGGHHPYAEPKMKDARTRIKHQIIQAAGYFKSRKKEKSVEKVVTAETENVYDNVAFIDGCTML